MRRPARSARSSQARRKELLRRVEGRVERYAREHDGRVVLASQAEDEARSLLEVVGWHPVEGGPSLDAEAILAVAWFHWLRADARPAHLHDDPGPRESDVELSIALFRPLYSVDPNLLPTELRELFGNDLPATDPGVIRYREYQQTRDPAALDDAAELLRQGDTAAEGEDAAMLARRLSNLSAVLRERYLLLGHDADIDDAVTAVRRAVDLTPLNDTERTGRLTNLGAALLTRFDAHGLRSDLDDAVETLRDAVCATEVDDPLRQVFLSNLAAALLTRFGLAGLVDDVDAAIGAAREAVAASGTDPEERGVALSTLGLALRERYEWTGVGTDLDEAVDVGLAAVEVLDGSGDAAYAQTNLSSSLFARYERDAAAEDLDRAEAAGRSAAETGLHAASALSGRT